MIVRGAIGLRLAGSRRERVPTGLLSGLAHLVVTGFFYRFEEAERAPAGRTALALMERIRDAHRLRVGRCRADGREASAVPPEAGTVEIEAEGGEGSGAFRLRLDSVSRHARGTPGVSLELAMVALPGELSDLGRRTGGAVAEAARTVAARLLADRDARDALLADGVARMQALQVDLLLICRRAAQVEAHSCEVGLAFPRDAGARPEPADALPAWHWLAALTAEGLAHPELVSDLAVWSGDFEGRFDPRGGSLSDTPAAGADGGGAFPAPGGEPAHPTAPPHDAGGGDL